MLTCGPRAPPAQVNFFLFRENIMAAAMPQMAPPAAATRLLLSGNEAVARAVWESGVRVAAAYPGTPSTEMLEVISRNSVSNLFLRATK